MTLNKRNELGKKNYQKLKRQDIPLNRGAKAKENYPKLKRQDIWGQNFLGG